MGTPERDDLPAAQPAVPYPGWGMEVGNFPPRGCGVMITSAAKQEPGSTDAHELTRYSYSTSRQRTSLTLWTHKER